MGKKSWLHVRKNKSLAVSARLLSKKIHFMQLCCDTLYVGGNIVNCGCYTCSLRARKKNNKKISKTTWIQNHNKKNRQGFNCDNHLHCSCVYSWAHVRFFQKQVPCHQGSCKSLFFYVINSIILHLTTCKREFFV